MMLTLIWLTAIGVIVLAERSTEHLPFAIATLLLSAAAISFIVGDFERALLLAGVLAAAVTAASTVKHDYSALKLTVTDVPLMFAGTARFFASQYPRAVLAVLTGAAAFILAVIATLIHGTGPSIALDVRVFLFSVTLVCVVIAFRLSGGAISFHRIMAQRRCFYSTFMASLIDPQSWQRASGLVPSDIANDPLPLMAAVPARAVDYPDIIVIQHESIFDPRIFGLPVEPTVQAFLSPDNGLHGILNVDIFGGGSWQSEFSLLTGLSSASFGSNSYHLFKQGAGRFHNALLMRWRRWGTGPCSRRAAVGAFSTTMSFIVRSALASAFSRTTSLLRSTSAGSRRQIPMPFFWKPRSRPTPGPLPTTRRPGFSMY